MIRKALTFLACAFGGSTLASILVCLVIQGYLGIGTFHDYTVFDRQTEAMQWAFPATNIIGALAGIGIFMRGRKRGDK